MCGYGRVGRGVVNALIADGNSVVVVEKKPDNWTAMEQDERLLDQLFFVKGDADNDVVLRGANLEHAAGLVACVGSDAMNVYIALAARRCYKDVADRGSRASDEIAARNLGEARNILDEAITPYASAGRDLAEAVKRHARGAEAVR